MVRCRFCNAEITPLGKRLPPHTAGNIGARACEGGGRTVELNGWRTVKPPRACKPLAPAPESTPEPAPLREEVGPPPPKYPFGLDEFRFAQLDGRLRKLHTAGFLDTEMATRLSEEFPGINATWVGRWRKTHGLDRNYAPNARMAGGALRWSNGKGHPVARVGDSKMIWDEDFDPGEGWNDDEEE